MHIVSLRAENVKRLKAIEIRPDGAIVELTGRNKQGKSSTLDAIWWALGGTRDIPSAPIRRGETEASIHLDLGAYKVTRTFHAQEDGSVTTYLKVQNADGAVFTKQQDLLNALVGDLTFDPLAFTQMKAAEQVELLKRFVPDFDFAADAAAYKRDYDKRTEVNREAKDLRARARTIEVAADAPVEPQDERPILEDLRTAGARNLALEQERAARSRRAVEITGLQTRAAQAFAAAEEARRRARQLEDEATELTECAAAQQAELSSLDALAEPLDTAALAERLQAIQAANALHAKAKQRLDLEGQAEVKEAESKALTEALDAREAKRAQVVAEADMPVQGLGFGDGEVMLNGLPFEQASDAEQLRTSVAIAAAMNPKLRVIRIRDGSRLDTEAMEVLAEYAAENELQIWVETVEGSRASAIVIEDGLVADAMLMAAE